MGTAFTITEHERALHQVEILMDRGDSRTPEENSALDLLVSRIETYEHEVHPLPAPSPHEMLAY